MEDRRDQSGADPARSGGSSVDRARAEAEHVAGEARDDAGAVVEEARHQAGEVVTEARDRAGELVGDARDRLREQADTQTARFASSMREVSTDLASMADHSEHPDSGVAEVVREVASGVGRVAGRIDDRGIDGALDDVRGYARRNPGRFLLGAAAAGFLVGRLLRNVDTTSITQGGGGEQGHLDLTSTPGGEEFGSSSEIPGPTTVGVSGGSQVAGGVPTSPLHDRGRLTEGGTPR